MNGDTSMWTRKEEKKAIWRLGWFRCFLYGSVVWISTFVALTENWSDIYLNQLGIPMAVFALVTVFFKCYVPTSTAVIAYMDQTIQALREEVKQLKSKQGVDEGNKDGTGATGSTTEAHS